MASARTVRRAALGTTVLAAAGALVAAGLAAAPSGNAAAAPACGQFFDEFRYSSSTGSDFAANGWIARSEAGGPGVSGATWSPGNITFPTVDGEQVAQLNLTTDGTGPGTTGAELMQAQNRFLAGTYATRMKFIDAPSSGADGDHVNQTFFVIGPPQRQDYDPQYSELDFSEYLPNGGWGEQGPINYQTSWNGYRAEPWDARNAHSQQAKSIQGWHTVVAQVAGNHVKYFIDGTQVGDHTVDDKTGTYPVYPRQAMSLRFNLWLIDTAGHSGGVSAYSQQMDWVYYAKDQVVSPADVVTRAEEFRKAGTARTDTLAGTGCGTATPTGKPTASAPTATPTTGAPTATPPVTAPGSPSPTAPPANCGSVAAWDWATAYLGGQRVSHNGRIWEANWWTQGSEPGLTAQWREIGSC